MQCLDIGCKAQTLLPRSHHSRLGHLHDAGAEAADHGEARRDERQQVQAGAPRLGETSAEAKTWPIYEGRHV